MLIDEEVCLVSRYRLRPTHVIPGNLPEPDECPKTQYSQTV